MLGVPLSAASPPASAVRAGAAVAAAEAVEAVAVAAAGAAEAAEAVEAGAPEARTGAPVCRWPR